MNIFSSILSASETVMSQNHLLLHNNSSFLFFLSP
uniref:Uncharacterized protein n=1 Tax=Rhizophora mucronata TaxID=61149 RepID=A0A2P2NYM2_RHIMU